MKLTTKQIKKLVKEEMRNLLFEGDRMIIANFEDDGEEMILPFTKDGEILTAFSTSVTELLHTHFPEVAKTEYGQKFKVALLQVLEDVDGGYALIIGDVELDRIELSLNSFHQKISDRLLSLENKNFTTIPAAMEEVDTLSLKMENAEKDVDIDEQIYQSFISFNINIFETF